MHVEYDMINLYPIIRNINAYSRKEKNCGDKPSMVLLYDWHLGETFIPNNTDPAAIILHL